MATFCRNLGRQRGCAWLNPATSLSTGSTFQRPSLSHNGHGITAPTRTFTVNSVKFRGPDDFGAPKTSRARDSPQSTSDAPRNNKSSRDYDRDHDRPSTSRSYDPFDRLSDGRDSGKFGRPSFGQQKSDSSRSRESSFNNGPSRDSYSGDSYKRTSSYASTGGEKNGRDYDPFVSRRSNLPSQNRSPNLDYLYSPNVVISALENTLRTPHTLYYSNTIVQNRKKKKDDPVSDCIKAAKDAGAKVIKTTKHELNEMADQRPHQGVILEASKLPHIFVKALGPVSDENYQLIGKSRETTFQYREKEPPVWIALDEVVDPQNLGAILRTALFLGVDGVIVCHKNSSPLSAVVAKASVGALEVRPTYGVSSLMKFIQDSQKNGWHVVGAHVTYGSKRSRPLHTWPDTGVDQPTLLVMGSEGNGLRKQIMNQCDSFIQVPSLSTTVSNVDSLNVSVATGIILSKLMGGRFLNLPKNLKKFPLRHSSPGNYDGSVTDNNDGNEEEEEEEDDDDDDNDDDDDDADDDEDDAADTKNSKKPLPF